MPLTKDTRKNRIFVAVAQQVERQIEDLGVSVSIPDGGITLIPNIYIRWSLYMTSRDIKIEGKLE